MRASLRSSFSPTVCVRLNPDPRGRSCNFARRAVFLWNFKNSGAHPVMLSIRNLSKSYGDVQALRDVSLEVPPGMFGLLGPNGAGKSSLMRTIATLQDPDSGSITFDGIDVAADKDRVRRSLGYLPQDFGVYPKVSAQDMLDHFAVLKG